MGRLMDGIQFLNGWYDLDHHKFFEGMRVYTQERTIPHAYSPKAKCPSFKNMLDQTIPEPSDRQRLLKWVAHAMVGSRKLEKMLILHGAGMNGKSTLINIFKQIWPSNQRSQKSLKNLKTMYENEGLREVKLNIMDDLPIREFNKYEDTFKYLISNWAFTGKNRFRIKDFLNETHHVAAINEPLNLKEITTIRRVEPVHCPTIFRNDSRDSKMKEKCTTEDEIQGLILWLLQILKEVEN